MLPTDTQTIRDNFIDTGSGDNLPPSNDIHEQLKQLALEAQRHPPLNLNRQKALQKLVIIIEKSGLLGHPQKGLFPPLLYADLYQEAKQRTLIDICQKIQNYNPKHHVMAWVNFTLSRRFTELAKENYNKQKILSIDALDQRIQKSQKDPPLERKLLGEFLENDPENLLKAHHIKDHPEATFQRLAIARFLEGKTWQEISTQFGIAIPSLSSFVTRKLHQLRPYFLRYLQE